MQKKKKRSNETCAEQNNRPLIKAQNYFINGTG